MTKAAFRRDRVLRGWTPLDLTDAPQRPVPPRPGALQAAIGDALTRDTPCHLRLEPGFHPGPVYIPPHTPPLWISGPGAQHCVLAAGVDAQMPGLEYRDRFAALFEDASAPVKAHVAALIARQRLTTQNASVLRVAACNVALTGFAIRNDYACDRREAAPTGAEPDAEGRFAEGQHQAVALHVAGADRVCLTDMHLSSFQDTLYLQTAAGRTLLERCVIEGDVDFIFGNGVAHFSDCEIRSRGARAGTSWAMAPSTNIHQDFGLVLERCRFVSDGRPMRACLARQWFEGVRATPFGTPDRPGYQTRLGTVNRLHGTQGSITRQTLEAVGKCVLIDCEIGPHIAPLWDSWSGPGWSPRYRPALTDAAAFRGALGPWLHSHAPDLSAAGTQTPWLAAL